MTDATRHARNEAKLAEAHPVVARKLRAVMADEEGHGYKPLLVEVHRDPILQARNYYARPQRSKVLWGFHCATDKKGKKEALAGDIVDARYLWNVAKYAKEIRAFITCQTNSCNAHHMLCGSKWTVAFGHWGDFAHCEIKGLTLADAKKGVRPK